MIIIISQLASTWLRSSLFLLNSPLNVPSSSECASSTRYGPHPAAERAYASLFWQACMRAFEPTPQCWQLPQYGQMSSSCFTIRSEVSLRLRCSTFNLRSRLPDERAPPPQRPWPQRPSPRPPGFAPQPRVPQHPHTPLQSCPRRPLHRTPPAP